MRGKVVLEYDERRELLTHIKWIDEIIDNVPWILDDLYLERHNIDYVCGSDDVYTDDGYDIFIKVKDLNKFISIPRTDGISSSLILSRVIRNYDYFINRIVKDDQAVGSVLTTDKLDLTTRRVDNIVKRNWHKIDLTDPIYRDVRINSFMKVFGETVRNTWNILGELKSKFIRKNLMKSGEVETTHSQKESGEVKALIIEECKNIVYGWNELEDSEITISDVLGGLTNRLYKCEIKEERANEISEKIKADVPNEVLVRIYGMGTEIFFNRESENKIFAKFSKMGIGPKLYGLFEGGRIEQFMRLKTLKQDDLQGLSILIATKLAIMHTTEMPLPKNPSLFDSLHHWIKIAQSIEFQDPKKQELYDSLNVSTEFPKELNYLKVTVAEMNSPIVFCHNDLLAGNIMYDEDKKRLCFIDYEYGSYNFRGYDIGNHFCERSINYDVKEFPFFRLDPSQYPTYEERREFVAAYLKEYRKRINIDTTVSEGDIKNLLKESGTFTLASHLLWSCWSLIQASTSDIEFGYLEFAVERMKDYYKKKRHLNEELWSGN